MHPLEKAAIAVRRSRFFRKATPIWNTIRPVYLRSLARFSPRGLERNINGTDRILIDPELYTLSESYEPQVWNRIMSEVKRGSVVADVGAYVGLYTIVFAKRGGVQGHVYAFEPDAQSRRWLERNVALNRVNSCVQIFPYAVGSDNSPVSFVSGRGSESYVALASSDHAEQVQAITLDSVFSEERVDLIKIDVEGFEEHVLRGGAALLKDTKRAPRVIFIEVHPFAWKRLGVSSESLLGLLQQSGYQVSDIDGNQVEYIEHYGEVVARRM